MNQPLQAEAREPYLLEHKLAEIRQQGAVARHPAIYDPLTNLPNRLLFNDRLEHGLAQAKRHGRALAVMFVNLDDLRCISNSFGRDAGNSVLQTIAGRLKENTRGEDTVSRHDGDLLCLLLEIRDERDITMIAEKIIQAIQIPCDIGVCDLRINASVGISIFPRNGTTADSLLQVADRAVSRAKQNRTGYSFVR